MNLLGTDRCSKERCNRCRLQAVCSMCLSDSYNLPLEMFSFDHCSSRYNILPCSSTIAGSFGMSNHMIHMFHKSNIVRFVVIRRCIPVLKL